MVNEKDKSSIGRVFACYWTWIWYLATKECFCLLGSGNTGLGVVFETSSTGMYGEKENICVEDRVGYWILKNEARYE